VKEGISCDAEQQAVVLETCWQKIFFLRNK